MKKKFLLPFLYLLIFSCYVFADTTSYTVETVPDPKQSGTGYISDPGALLNDNTRSEIHTLLAQLEQKTSDQVAVVMLNSIGDAVPKDFAYTLFNKWGIGVKGKNNGLLILMVMDQRRVEFETGYGMESVLPDALCKRIQTNYMVPRFKEGNYDQGMLDGIKAITDILQNKENSSYFTEMTNLESSETSGSSNAFPIFLAIAWLVTALIVFSQKVSNKSFKDLYAKAFPEEKDKVSLVISKGRWALLYVVIPIAMLAYLSFDASASVVGFMYLYLAFIFIEKRIRANAWHKTNSKGKDYYTTYQSYTKSHKYWWWVALFFPFPFLFYLFYYLSKKTRLRNHPRNCQGCATPMTKLSEQQDDQFLSKSQVLEEQLKSVDYDVWYCNTCTSREILSFTNLLSRYSTCDRCNSRTYYLDRDVTLVAATYDSSGTGRKTYLCKYCGHSKNETYTIAQKVSSTSSDSSSSSSYSSSSDSGGSSSWDGGSSGGGGSGSSW